MVNKNQIDAIFDWRRRDFAGTLSSGHGNTKELIAILNVGEEDLSAYLNTSLEHAVKEMNGEAVEALLSVIWRLQIHIDLVDIYIALLPASWHYEHENIVNILQDLKDTRTTQILYKTALTHYDYLDYDEGFGLARKCTWALADIGTTEARLLLKELAKNENKIIAHYAQKRLDNWDAELSRKGAVTS